MVRRAAWLIAVVLIVDFVGIAAWGQEKNAKDRALIQAVVDQINNSKSVQWKTTFYTRWTSKDGNQTGLLALPASETAYRAPDSYRDTRYDASGNSYLVEIVNATSMETLRLDMQSKQATRTKNPINVYGPGHPLANVEAILDSADFVGNRDINGVKVDIYRLIRKSRNSSMDIWLDRDKKRLVGISIPGGDQLDPSATRQPENIEIGSRNRAGLVRSDYVFDAPLDAELFSLEAPDGFELMK